MAFCWGVPMFDNSLDSVGSALHFVLLAGRFLVSNIPNGAERVRGPVTANWKSMRASRPWPAVSPGGADTWLGSWLWLKWEPLVPAAPRSATSGCSSYFLRCRLTQITHCTSQLPSIPEIRSTLTWPAEWIQGAKFRSRGLQIWAFTRAFWIFFSFFPARRAVIKEAN